MKNEKKKKKSKYVFWMKMKSLRKESVLIFKEKWGEMGLHTDMNKEDLVAKMELLTNDPNLYDRKHMTRCGGVTK